MLSLVLTLTFRSQEIATLKSLQKLQVENHKPTQGDCDNHVRNMCTGVWPNTFNKKWVWVKYDDEKYQQKLQSRVRQLPSLQTSNSNNPRVTWDRGLRSVNHSMAHLHCHPSAATRLLPRASGTAAPPPRREPSLPPVQPTRHMSPCSHSTFL